MHPPRQVPGIAQQRHTFQPAELGRIQSPLAAGAPQQQSPEAAIGVQVQELAIQIYSDAAVAHLSKHGIPVDPTYMRKLAQEAQTAARAYFESMGVQFDGGS